MRELITLPNAITSAGLAAGFLGLLAAASAELVQAAGFVAIAAGCDALDGFMARRNGEDSAFGSNLDSLADLMSFGVVPAMALYVGPLGGVPLGLIVCLGFLLAGAWRLARFPLVMQDGHFVGLPIPVAGVAVMLLVLWRPGTGLALLIVVAASALMVSTLRFPTLTSTRTGLTAIMHAAPYRRR